jgi:hypothetical protein
MFLLHWNCWQGANTLLARQWTEACEGCGPFSVLPQADLNDAKV